MVYSKILGSGSALPELKVSNDDLAKKLAQKGIETSDEWINSRTGISQRYIASDSETTSTLATKAAKLAMENAGVTADDIDLIVLGTSTPDHIFPSTACLIQANLGVENGAAFDVQAVCSGFLYALTVADKFIKSNASKMALVIGADTLTKILDWNDRRTCVLFGDGAGAVVLGASEEAGIIATQINSMGSLNGILNTLVISVMGKLWEIHFYEWMVRLCSSRQSLNLKNLHLKYVKWLESPLQKSIGLYLIRQMQELSLV